MKAQIETRRLYRFEELFLHKRGMPGMKDTSIGALRALATKVWAKHNTTDAVCPKIWASEGTMYNGSFYSYYEDKPVHKIVMARNQRRPTLLLHELAHALGGGSKSNHHNKKFCTLYFGLLHEYIGYDLEELRLQAASFKIKSVP